MTSSLVLPKGRQLCSSCLKKLQYLSHHCSNQVAAPRKWTNPTRPLLTNIIHAKRKMAVSILVAGTLSNPGPLVTFRPRIISISLACKGSMPMSQMLDMAPPFSNAGSWYLTLNARPTQWLRMRHSAWLLFGVCSCFSAAASAVGPDMFTGSPENVEPTIERTNFDQLGSGGNVVAAKACHGKQVYTKYTVIGIPGDGRCLFRAIMYGAQLRSGKDAPDKSLQREYADELRQKVVDELVRRREETEWFIEGDFGAYTKRMRQPHVWGGEPELLMASHVLKMPIFVYIVDYSLQGLISIAEYGLEFGKENSEIIRVLYDGSGHYDALQFPSSVRYPYKEEL